MTEQRLPYKAFYVAIILHFVRKIISRHRNTSVILDISKLKSDSSGILCIIVNLSGYLENTSLDTETTIAIPIKEVHDWLFSWSDFDQVILPIYHDRGFNVLYKKRVDMNSTAVICGSVLLGRNESAVTMCRPDSSNFPGLSNKKINEIARIALELL